MTRTEFVERYGTALGGGPLEWQFSTDLAELMGDALRERDEARAERERGADTVTDRAQAYKEGVNAGLDLAARTVRAWAAKMGADVLASGGAERTATLVKEMAEEMARRIDAVRILT
jgi:hypothetical protein